jgi:small-conductance mechanosensitive channel
VSTTAIHDLTTWLQQWLPPELARVAVAAGIIALGYLVATAIRFVVVRVFRRLSGRLLSITRRASERAGIAHAPDATRGAEAAALGVAGRIAFWVVFALFLGAASTLLGFPILTEWLASLAGYLPHVLAATAIVLLGILSGLMLRVTVTAATRSAGFLYAQALGRAAQIAVVALAIVVAIEELGIQVTFLVVVAATVLGAALGGAALAFGLGARRSVSNLMASHYLAKWYRVGHVVRIGEHEGRIAEILPSAIVLHTGDGKLYVPAGEFARGASLLVADEGGE